MLFPRSGLAVFLAAVIAAACADHEGEPRTTASAPCDDPAVRRVVTSFGDRMKLVSLQAPDSTATEQLDGAYADIVSAELLARWRSDPERAPGRLTSSPWPDRIEIDSARADDAGGCVIDGTLIHMTSVEATGGGAAGRDAVRITLRAAADSAWRISAYEVRSSALRPPAAPDSLGAPAAIDVLRRYYDAINARDYRTAFLLWGDSGRASGKTFDSFAQGYAETARVDLDVGTPGRIEGAAGSRFVEIPVSLRATLRSGAPQRYAGSYTLRRSVVDGASAALRRWHIHAARLNRIS